MQFIAFTRSTLRESVRMFWTLARITVPVLLLTRLASDLGLVEALAPATSPVMAALGLPPELGFAWLTGVLVGVWGGAAALFAIVPAERLSSADVTVFMSLLLFAHGLPMEQRIVQKAGASFLATSALRLAGGLIYAFLVSRLFHATGALSEPAAPVWSPSSADPSLAAFLWGTLEALISMLAIIIALVAALRLAEAAGLTARLTVLLAPVLRRVGICEAAVPTVIVGLILGLSYGGALIIEQAKKGAVAPRELFLALVFLGFAHSMIEDTALAVALGADFATVFLGRLAFSFGAIALIAWLLSRLSDRTFSRLCSSGSQRLPERDARSTP